MSTHREWNIAMEIEYLIFYNVTTRGKRFCRGQKRLTPVSDVVERVPQAIITELSNPPLVVNNISLYVETKKKAVIKYLDEILTKQKVAYDKARHIEVTKDEIEKYDYYYIDLTNLEWNSHIDYEVSKPTCTCEGCPWGARIMSPLKLRAKHTTKLNFGKCIDIWSLGVRFVVSQKLKNIFDSSGVTGLDYEPCVIQTGKRRWGSEMESENRFYTAEIRSSVRQKATEILLRSYCKKHRIAISSTVIGRTIPRSHISKDDFQVINRVVVKGKEYFFKLPYFFVSKKVLKLLFENNISDLRSRAIFFENGLTPVPFD